MTSEYTYSLANDFGGNINYRQFHNEIVSSSINNTLNGITALDDFITIEFVGTLTVPETNTLDNLVANHIPVSSLGKNFVNCPITATTVCETGYATVSSLFLAKDIFTQITHIKMVSHIDNGSYTVRISDQLNNQIYLGTFTNTDIETNNLTPLTNLPTIDSTLYIDCYVNNASNTMTVKNIIIYYNL